MTAPDTRPVPLPAPGICPAGTWHQLPGPGEGFIRHSAAMSLGDCAAFQQRWGHHAASDPQAPPLPPRPWFPAGAVTQTWTTPGPLVRIDYDPAAAAAILQRHLAAEQQRQAEARTAAADRARKRRLTAAVIAAALLLGWLAWLGTHPPAHRAPVPLPTPAPAPSPMATVTVWVSPGPGEIVTRYQPWRSL